VAYVFSKDDIMGLKPRYRRSAVTWFKNVLPVFAEHAKIKDSRIMWSGGLSDELTPISMLRLYGKALELFDRNGRILDLGCGIGFVLNFITEVSGLSLEPFGLEALEFKVNMCRERILPGFNHNIVQKVYRTRSDFPFDHQFDFIIVSVPRASILDDIDFLEGRVSEGGKLLYMLYGDSEEFAGEDLKEKLAASGYESKASYLDRKIYAKEV
jgi:SAM-dependent methyltransferase